MQCDYMYNPRWAVQLLKTRFELSIEDHTRPHMSSLLHNTTQARYAISDHTRKAS